MAQKVGLMVGGIGLAALSIPFGAAVGAWTGYQAGSGQMQARVDDMAARYNPSVVRGFLNIAEPLGGPAAQVHEKLPFGKKILGGAIGATMGLAMGTAGALWQGFNWGKTFGGLWAGNRTADALGHLPPTQKPKPSCAPTTKPPPLKAFPGWGRGTCGTIGDEETADCRGRA